MSISIPQSKLDEIRNLIQKVLPRKTITRRKLESVIGKLSYIADCIRSARLFIARLLELLRSVKRKNHHINLNAEAKKDLRWFLKFMDRYNGRTAIPEDDWCSPDEIMASDSTLVGIGGVHWSSSGMQYFHEVIPPEWKDQHICVYELLAILVCLHTWSSRNQNKRILMQCDNLSCVLLLNTGTQDNRLPDLLSRIDLLANAHDKLVSELPDNAERVLVEEQAFELDFSV